MILSAHNIHKRYGNLSVLNGIHLQIEKGSFTAIVGASGAGKSTLLQILGTLDKPDEGYVEIENTQLHTLKDKELALLRNQKIGFVFQFHNLLPEFSALENVCIAGLLGNRSKSEVEKKATFLLQKLGIEERQHHKPSEMSGGEQQRVAVARALVNSPAILFADEPSGNLDAKNASELHRLFFDLRQEMNLTFVVVTHSQELAAMADKKIELSKGIIIN